MGMKMLLQSATFSGYGNQKLALQVDRFENKMFPKTRNFFEIPNCELTVTFI
jgi:hypothetical protein